MRSVHGSPPWRVTILQLGEEPAHLVEQRDVLRRVPDARTGHARGRADRDVELDALRVDRVHLLVVDRDLRVQARPGTCAPRLRSYRSTSRSILRTASMPSFGSTLRPAKNRSGCSRSARSAGPS